MKGTWWTWPPFHPSTVFLGKLYSAHFTDKITILWKRSWKNLQSISCLEFSHEFEWTSGVGDGQGGLECCDSWGCKESDTTEWLSWLNKKVSCIFSKQRESYVTNTYWGTVLELLISRTSESNEKTIVTDDGNRWQIVVEKTHEGAKWSFLMGRWRAR